MLSVREGDSSWSQKCHQWRFLGWAIDIWSQTQKLLCTRSAFSVLGNSISIWTLCWVIRNKGLLSSLLVPAFPLWSLPHPLSVAPPCSVSLPLPSLFTLCHPHSTPSPSGGIDIPRLLEMFTTRHFPRWLLDFSGRLVSVFKGDYHCLWSEVRTLG